MPGMHGLTLIHEVRKRKEPIAIVIVTANSSVKTVADAEKNMGYDYHLTKPVNIEELKSVLEKVVEENADYVPFQKSKSHAKSMSSFLM